MKENQHPHLKLKISLFLIVFGGLVLLRVWLSLIQVELQPGVHLLWEFVAVSLAGFVGVLALVRFFTRKDTVYLFIGIGYVGAALLDGFHLANVGRYLTDIGTFYERTVVSHAEWHTAVVFLAVCLAGSWLIWFRGQGLAALPRRFLIGVGAALLLNILYFAIVPWQAGQIRLGFQHTAVAVGATFFLLALLGYLEKRNWMFDPFENWLIISLIIIYTSQALFAIFSTNPYDLMFLTALLLQATSYLCVLIGLLISMVSIFRRAEMMAQEQAIINETLQYEITERKKYETAEQEQRRLAEALREVGIALSSVLEFDRLLNILLDQIARVMPYDTANVMLVHDETIEISVTRGYGQDIQPGIPQKFNVSRIPSLRHILATEAPLIIPDTAKHELWVNPEESPHVRSWAGAPISMKGEVIAVLALNNSQSDFYRPGDAGRLSAFAGQAAAAFENARLYEEVRQRAEELSTLNTISQAISSTLNLRETLTIITESTVRLLHVEAASVVLHDVELDDLVFAAASGQAADFVKGQRLALGQGVIGWVVEHGEPVLVPNPGEDDRHFADFDEQSGFQARTILCVPLQTKGQTIGALEALNKDSGLFDEEDLELLIRLATPAATAIENAQLFAQAQQEISERARVEKALEAERALLARRVTERTADLSTANAELARAARLKDEFLASMSHELRTPLNAILGISEALQEEVYGPLNENQIRSLHSVEESGRHLLALINDILDLSKIEAGKLELELMPISVESVCQASLRLIKQNAHKKRLTIKSSFDSSASVIMADERRMKQILVNLLSNAVKFTSEGGDIGLDVVGDDEKKAVHITVWDTGIGISEEGLSRLFQPFVQLDSRLSREFGGTGLGLSLVQRMMELHGGAVAVESELGKGSRFTISFPWQRDQPLLSLEDQRGAFAEDGLSGLFRLALVIDDSPAATAQMRRYLNELRIDVIAQQYGLGAVEQAKGMHPDVIVLDILLPDVSGWDVLAALKAEPETRSIPVLVVSVIDERENALAAGATDCLLKPVSRQQLYNTLQRLRMQQQTAPVTAVKSTTSKNSAGDRPRILLAEDNQANVNTFTHYLTAKGYDIIIANNGLEAIAQAKAEKPDLILMDIQMPQLSGLDAIREIRADEAVRDIPIIAVTALAMPGDQEKCLAAGANDYISKPVSLKGLLDRIKAQLN